jgi:putative ABC transport system permease protein
MSFRETLVQSLRNIRANLLRASLTVMIIALGIMALVGILTSLDSLINALSTNFSGLGANAFSIEPKNSNLRGQRRGRMDQISDVISFRQALAFRDQFETQGKTSVSLMCTSLATVAAGEKKTNPNITLLGVDAGYFDVQAFKYAAGRPFTTADAQGAGVVVLGGELARILFKDEPASAVGQKVHISNLRFVVVGVLEKKGAGATGATDRVAMIPLAQANALYDTPDKNYDITVALNDPLLMGDEIERAQILMRRIRKLRIFDENDFSATSSSGLLSLIKENTVMIRSATVAIGLITLLGAAIGLMNIMLVSVTERTREIGIVKSLGASSRVIRRLFLTEAVLICQIGGIVGVVLGVLVGNVLSVFLESPFLMPWNWILLGLVLCFVVGVVAGYYPANRAAGLDPIESLRYE